MNVWSRMAGTKMPEHERGHATDPTAPGLAHDTTSPHYGYMLNGAMLNYCARQTLMMPVFVAWSSRSLNIGEYQQSIKVFPNQKNNNKLVELLRSIIKIK